MDSLQLECIHEEFESQVIVARIIPEEGAVNIVAHQASVKIRCKKCKLPFEFIGLPLGMMNTQPTANVDGTELRAPIKPSIPM